MLSQDAATASVPAFLLLSTVKAATRFAARQAAATGLVSADVAALTKGVLTAMLLSKINVVVALLLTAVVLVSSTGLLISQASAPNNQEKKSQASARDDQERKDARQAPRPRDTERITADFGEVADVYLNNAALFDEKFTGKRIVVTGIMDRIIGLPWNPRTPANPQEYREIYYLEMDPGGNHRTPLHFGFGENDRKQLAKLKKGQSVTVEGELRQRNTGEGPIHFYNCKILKPKAED
jgi:hypothetical protein